MTYITIAVFLILCILLILNRNELLEVIKNKDEKLEEALKQVTTLDITVKALYEQNITTVKMCDDLMDKLDNQVAKNSEVLSAKKSSEVRLGSISENALGLLANIPYDCHNLRHLGQPIDFVYFSYEPDPYITFVEVKSGKAKESKRQNLIKNIIKEGKVHYDLVQITEDGVKVTRKI